MLGHHNQPGTVAKKAFLPIMLSLACLPLVSRCVCGCGDEPGQGFVLTLLHNKTNSSLPVQKRQHKIAFELQHNDQKSAWQS